MSSLCPRASVINRVAPDVELRYRHRRRPEPADLAAADADCDDGAALLASARVPGDYQATHAEIEKTVGTTAAEGMIFHAARATDEGFEMIDGGPDADEHQAISGRRQ
jgi:hypothetical protein